VKKDMIRNSNCLIEYFKMMTIKGDSFKCNGEKFIIFKDFPLMYNPSTFQPYFKFKIFKNLKFQTINLCKEDIAQHSLYVSIEPLELINPLIKSTRILLIELNYNKKC
jgi:hypothetical protein